MLIVADIGNTNITIGMYKLEKNRPIAAPPKIWRLSTNREETVDEYTFKILNILSLAAVNPSDVKDFAIASVVPDIDPIMEQSIQNIFGKKPFFVSSENIPVLKIRFKNPLEIGPDRLAAALAGYELKRGPVIVIDFGTATTFDCVNGKGEYLGGAIVPGLSLAAKSLQEHTAKLPRVKVVRPKKAIGNSTVECIQSGIYFGYIGLVKEILARLKKELNADPLIVATGGLADLVAKDIPEIKEIIPQLVLEGIKITWEKSH